MKNCTICQKEFEPATKKQKFCSNSCRQKNFRKEVKEMLAEIREKKAKIKPIEDVLGIKSTKYPILEEKPVIKPKNDKLEPPAGLTGIDLAIWKSENWE
jgi:hypothetical protein